MDPIEIQAILADMMSPVMAAITEAAGALADAMTTAAETISVSFEEAAAAVDPLQGAIDGATAAAGGLAGAADAAGVSMDGAAVSADGAAASLDGAAASADAAGASIGDLNFGPLSMMGVAAVVAGGAFIKMGADGEDALTRVQALTGASKGQMEQYSATLDTMAGKFGASVSDLSGGLYDIVSVGYQGKDALNTLKVAAEAAAAGGTDLHTVTSGLTSIMKAFGVQGKDASTVMDTLLLGVRDGKASFQDFSNAIGLVATTAKGAGFGLKESTAALSTLTAVFPNARRAGMDLQHLLTSIGVNAAATGAAAKKMGLHFDQAKFNSLGLQGRLEYLQTITHGNQAEMLKLTGGSAGFAAAQVLLANKSADFTRNLKDQKNATGATKNAFDTWSQSVGSHAKNMTGSLSSVAQQFVVMAGPAITGGLDALSHVIQGLGNFLSFLATHGDAAKAIMIPLAGVLGGILTFALYAAATAAWAFLAPILVAAAPFILIGLAIGVVVAGIVLLVTHWKQVSAWLSGVWNAIVTRVGQGFSWLGTQAHNAVTTVGNWFSWLGTQIHDRIARLINTVRTYWAMIPVLFHAALEKAQQIVSNALHTVVGWFSWLYNHNYYFQRLVDFIHQRFVNLRNNLTAIWNAITGWLHTQWAKIQHLAQVAFAFVKMIAQRDWEAVQRFIIVPIERAWARIQLVAALIQFKLREAWGRVKADVQSAWNRFVATITGAGDKAKSAVHDHVVSPITTAVSNLIGLATGWGQKLIQMLISGIQSKLGDLKNAAANIANTIKNFLGFHSPTKEGPGSDADTWMPNMVNMMASGLRSHGKRVLGQAASAVAGDLAAPFSGGMGAAALAGSGAAGLIGAGAGGGGAAHVHVHLHADDAGFSMGMRLMTPSVQHKMAQEVAEEMARQGFLQGKQPIPYTGHN